MRAEDIEDPIERVDTGIALLGDWARRPAARASRFLTRAPELAKRTLLRLGVSTRSILGAVVFETGGLIRLWGSDPERSLLHADRSTAIVAGRDHPEILLVGDDAFGGLFAVNRGGFGEGRRDLRSAHGAPCRAGVRPPPVNLPVRPDCGGAS